MWSILRTVGTAVLQPAVRIASTKYNTVISSWYHSLSRPSAPTNFLVPQTVISTQTAGLKVKGLLKLRCKDCRFYMKDQRLWIYCMSYPKHNQVSMIKKKYNRWSLTHACQSKIRPY